MAYDWVERMTLTLKLMEREDDSRELQLVVCLSM